MTDALESVRATFFDECAELMEALETNLLALSEGSGDGETVGAIFRAVHSIKGGAGAFGLTALVTFAHDLETVLDALRSGRISPNQDLCAALLRACDHLGDLISLAAGGAETGVEWPEMADLLAQVSADGRHVERTAPPPDPSICWDIDFRPRADLLETGNEPLYIFRALSVLGRIDVTADDSGLPSLDALDPEVACLNWQIRLWPTSSDLTLTEIEQVFEFTIDLCELSIEQAGGDRPPPEPDLPAASTATPISRPAPDDAIGLPAPVGGTPFGSSIRVDLERVDRLVNLVGELVITQSMLAQSLTRDGSAHQAEREDALEDLQQLTRDIQDSVMAIRAQPVKSLFQRMTRIVREAAQMTGKNVRLVCEGEDTEIDKTMIERLAEPLTHLVRNAIDHGLEGEVARRDAGKDATGTISLSARQQSDRVLLKISDDGAGIDHVRVRAQAEKVGLISPDDDLDPQQIERLIFQPGFSTSASVSALSGRGVGMDVVQHAIRDLDGKISIQSRPGEGCTVIISLPLTLAILDGMIVRAATQRMVIPLSTIVETQTREMARIDRLARGRTMAALHDRFVPLVDLARGMGFEADPDADPEEAALLFLHTDELGDFAVAVDGIEAQRQVVVKGLGDSFGKVCGVSAATILGDGQIALIVDPAGLAILSGLAGAAPDRQGLAS